MPRRPRIHLDGLPLHIVQRGHNREACFFCEEDYQSYLHWLSEALLREQVALHAYALMTNHVHLLLTPTSGESVARLIMSLGRRYVQSINRSYRRAGTLWDSRYKSSLIDADTYLPTPICSAACATSNSTRCARAWSMTRRTTVGPATGAMALGRPMRG